MEQIEQLTEIKKIEGAFEAILFAAGHPMEYTAIAEALSLTPRDARRIAEHLSEKYNSDDTSGIIMLMFEKTCQLCTREIYAPYIREALGIRRGGNLSASSMEVLAIVAYNQPVTRTFIDTVRGVDSAYAVGSLLDKELIEPVGRLDAPGRPMLYGTTTKFLRVFGLNDLTELPEADSVLAAVDSLAQEAEPDESSEEAEAAGNAEDTEANENGEETAETENNTAADAAANDESSAADGEKEDKTE